MRTLRQKVAVEAFQILQILGHQNASSAEGGRRRDEPGKENVELKNCIALVVIICACFIARPKGAWALSRRPIGIEALQTLSVMFILRDV